MVSIEKFPVLKWPLTISNIKVWKPLYGLRPSITGYSVYFDIAITWHYVFSYEYDKHNMDFFVDMGQ